MKTLSADQLLIGDTLLNDDGSFESVVHDVFTDNYGTWVETDNDMGYVRSYMPYSVEDDD